MKKLLLGCGLVALVVTIAGGALAYFYVYLPARDYVASFAHLKELPQLNENIRNKSAFTPPARGELTQDLVDRFIRTQEAIRQKMGPRIDELDAKYKAFQQGRGANAQPSITEVVQGLKDLGSLLMEVKRAQVDALNEHGFSLDEYQWTRNTIYQALGMPLQEGLDEIISKATDPDAAHRAIEDVQREVPEINRKLVAPFADKLGDMAALAFFGI
jgi:hypothetical protein